MKEKEKIEQSNNRFVKAKNAIKGNQKEIKAHVRTFACQPVNFYLNTLIDCELIKTFTLAIFIWWKRTHAIFFFFRFFQSQSQFQTNHTIIQPDKIPRNTFNFAKSTTFLLSAFLDQL